MKKIFGFTKKKKKTPSSTPDNGSVLSAGYELRDKDLGKVHRAAATGDVVKLRQLAKKNDVNQLDKENRCSIVKSSKLHFLITQIFFRTLVHKYKNECCSMQKQR